MTARPKFHTPDDLPKGGPVWEQPTHYTVSALPPDDAEHSYWALEVVWRGGGDRWTVQHIGGFISRSGARQTPPRRVYSPINREQFRYPLQEALAIAREAAPRVAVNGMTAEMVLEWRRQRALARGEASA